MRTQEEERKTSEANVIRDSGKNGTFHEKEAEIGIWLAVWGSCFFFFTSMFIFFSDMHHCIVSDCQSYQLSTTITICFCLAQFRKLYFQITVSLSGLRKKFFYICMVFLSSFSYLCTHIGIVQVFFEKNIY